MKTKTLREKIKEIVIEAIENQMDWEGYCVASWEEPVSQLESLFKQAVEEIINELWVIDGGKPKSDNQMFQYEQGYLVGRRETLQKIRAKLKAYLKKGGK